MNFETFLRQFQGYLTTINARSGRNSLGEFESLNLGQYGDEIINIQLKQLDKLVEGGVSEGEDSPEGSDIFKSECLVFRKKIIEFEK